MKNDMLLNWVEVRYRHLCCNEACNIYLKSKVGSPAQVDITF
jgi:hypothetical protein